MHIDGGLQLHGGEQLDAKDSINELKEHKQTPNVCQLRNGSDESIEKHLEIPVFLDDFEDPTDAECSQDGHERAEF